MDIIGDFQVACQRGRPTDRTAAPDVRATSNRDTGRNRRMFPDGHVMADLNQVVELNPVLDNRIFEGTAVDGRVGADLNIVTDLDRPSCGTLTQMPSSLAMPKPSAPITTPG